MKRVALRNGRDLTAIQTTVVKGFEEGHPRYGGRAKGTKNRSTNAMRDIMEMAAAAVGEDGKAKDGYFGWLKMMCRNHPLEFLVVMAKLQPKQFHAQIDQSVDVYYETVEEAKAALEKQGIVIDHVVQ
jgi:hypothetical protein